MLYFEMQEELVKVLHFEGYVGILTYNNPTTSCNHKRLYNHHLTFVEKEKK